MIMMGWINDIDKYVTTISFPLIAIGVTTSAIDV